MPGSIIIFSGSKDARKDIALSQISKMLAKSFSWEKLLKNPDIRILETPKDKKSIGIADVKEAAGFISEKPFQEKYKFLIIADAGVLTREAQNSLLKTLEEPPRYAGIILLTKTLSDLLDTVISRCKKVRVGESKKEKADLSESNAAPESGKVLEKKTESKSEGNSYLEVLKRQPAERLNWAGEVYKEEKEDVIEILEDWIAQARKIMIDSPSVSVLNNIEKINEVKNDIENTNVNVRLALEALILNLE